VRLKSYFSGTVEAAMELAQKELGEDALLVNARPAMPETRGLGAYEVVFGIPPQVEATVAAKSATAAFNAPARAAANESLAQGIAELKREMERMTRAFRSGRVPAPQAAQDNLLIEQELDSSLAAKVTEGTPLVDLFEVDATLGVLAAARRVVALVGPPGVGKTTTLAKLAARFGIASRKPAFILSADVYRIAAAEQLRSLAAILGIGFEAAETPAAMSQALEAHRGKDWIFIDTPGLAAGEMEDGAELAALIASHPEIDSHLVLSASMKPADLARVIDRYEIFHPKTLLFTRLDETERYGALVNEAVRRGLPISFLSTGQQIPDDLEPASKEWIAGRIHDTNRISTLTLGATA
jgi:flagellar biosynthesis protein FlhF